MKFKLRGRWLRALLWVGLLAYPMPSSVVLLDLQATGVA